MIIIELVILMHTYQLTHAEMFRIQHKSLESKMKCRVHKQVATQLEKHRPFLGFIKQISEVTIATYIMYIYIKKSTIATVTKQAGLAIYMYVDAHNI